MDRNSRFNKNRSMNPNNTLTSEVAPKAGNGNSNRPRCGSGNGRARITARPVSREGQATDMERRQFLDALDNSDVIITDWETDFLEFNAGRIHFTPGRREVIDRLRMKYGEWVGF